ncbi:hypothetical protein RSOLAG22IIIB_00532 [Rhizoctonia solani]|uniref:Uncharacterized protein n=1 Tax=Rhizoctonia solani TaxID=456999 RepID=A0A0K6FW05_9AGAM|nr:hypothetical protein RSOLAG22IIIB_00532 [Rhizoctonia solani]
MPTDATQTDITSASSVTRTFWHTNDFINISDNQTSIPIVFSAVKPLTADISCPNTIGSVMNFAMLVVRGSIHPKI